MGRALSFEALGEPPRATWQASLKRLGRGKHVLIGIPDGSPTAEPSPPMRSWRLRRRKANSYQQRALSRDPV